jgi:hypothetical protein
MIKSLTISIKTHWIKEDPSCLECSNCEDIIYSITYRLNFKVNDKMTNTKIVLCESCYNLVK